MYYLQSRYYDPELGRFINADAFASTGQGILGTNMFAYCANNPVNMADPHGNFFLPALIPPLIYEGLKLANFSGNSEFDEDKDTTTSNKLINDQNGATGENFKYGFFEASFNACETIAVHNAKVLLGMDSTLSETMYDVQSQYAMIAYGLFGSYPHLLGRVLSHYGIEYTRVGLDEMTQPGVYIISFWNNGAPWNGLHTVAVFYDGTTYTTYNLAGRGNESYSNPSDYAGNYICGYYMGG